MRRGYWTRAQVAECILLLVGLICIGWCGWSIADAQLYQSYEGYKLDATLRGEEASIVGYLRDLISKGRDDADVTTEAEVESSQDRERPAMVSGSMVGRLEIPRIKVSTIVREGSDETTLKRAAGHISSTALPGDRGNVGIAAHRDSFFRNLRHVREGDSIRMETMWGTYEYVVDSLEIVSPQNVEVLASTPSPALTLVTCYPFNFVGHAPKRFIVHARQVNPPPQAGKIVTSITRKNNPHPQRKSGS
jgi:sortase A